MNRDLVISSRVRLARNLGNKCFPHLLNTMAKQALSANIKQEINRDGELPKRYRELAESHNLGEIKLATDKQFFHELPLSDIKLTQIYSLMEQNLISKELADRPNGSELLFTPDFDLSIMLQEEDHLRIQALVKGADIELALRRAQVVADFCEHKLPLAKDVDLGYLTACPSNVGTGLRASVMLRLTGLKILKQLEPLRTKLAKAGYVLRGAHGENSEAESNLFQLSQDKTLGHSDSYFVRQLHATTEQLIEQELAARKYLYEHNTLVVKDQILRAISIVDYALLVSESDLQNTLSWLDFAAFVSEDELGEKCRKLLPKLEKIAERSGTYTLLHNQFPEFEASSQQRLQQIISKHKNEIQQARALMIKKVGEEYDD